MAKSTKKAAPVATKTFDATEKNRDVRLKRHLKNHPNDGVAAEATKRSAPVRKKSKVKGSVSKTKVQKIVVHLGKDVGFRSVVPSLATGSDMPFRAPRTKQKDFEGQVRAHRQSASQVFKETQGQFGKVPEKNEAQIKENVKALCFGLGIHYTGKAFAPRRAYKGKR